jgi:hypothetical protein
LQLAELISLLELEQPDVIGCAYVEVAVRVNHLMDDSGFRVKAVSVHWMAGPCRQSIALRLSPTSLEIRHSDELAWAAGLLMSCVDQHHVTPCKWLPGRHYTANPVLVGQIGDPVIGVAWLERPCAWEFLALEPYLFAGAIRQHPPRDDRVSRITGLSRSAA